jgi:hypothetical protein
MTKHISPPLLSFTPKTSISYESNPKTYYEHRMSCLAFYRKLQLQEVYELDGETRDIEPLGATLHNPLSLSLSLSLSLAYFQLKDLHLLSSLTIKKQLQKL